MKAYQVICTATGALVWETNNMLAAYRRIDKLGAGYSMRFNYNA